MTMKEWAKGIMKMMVKISAECFSSVRSNRNDSDDFIVDDENRPLPKSTHRRSENAP